MTRYRVTTDYTDADASGAVARRVLGSIAAISVGRAGSPGLPHQSS
jgi:hypothetical protein